MSVYAFQVILALVVYAIILALAIWIFRESEKPRQKRIRRMAGQYADIETLTLLDAKRCLMKGKNYSQKSVEMLTAIDMVLDWRRKNQQLKS
jgi:hypothetical protein